LSLVTFDSILFPIHLLDDADNDLRPSEDDVGGASSLDAESLLALLLGCFALSDEISLNASNARTCATELASVAMSNEQ
jgi:hypothetical protein